MAATRLATDVPVISLEAIANGSIQWTGAPVSEIGGVIEGPGWNEWVEHLKSRRRPRALGRLLPGRGDWLSWNLPRSIPEGTRRLLSRLAGLQRKTKARADASRWSHDADRWLSIAAARQPDARMALECLAWCHGLPRLASILGADVWCRLLGRLRTAAADGRKLDLVNEPWAQPLMAGELALTLSYLFPELAECRQFGATALGDLEAAMEVILDEEGLPKCSPRLLRPLLACWTRCQVMAARLDVRLSKQARRLYRDATLNVLRMSRQDGSQSLLNDSAGERNSDLLQAAVGLIGSRSIERVHRLASKRNVGKAKPQKRLPPPAVHSEAAQLGILRPTWQRSSPRLAISYRGPELLTELSVGRSMLWSGPWALELHVNGDARQVVSDWEELCWVSDADADYLELEIELTGNARVQRQILLARKDNVLFLADAVLLSEPGSLQYSASLPALQEDVAFEAAAETRDGHLVGGKQRSTVLPLALPEWRADRRGGTLSPTAAGLELRQSAQGQALYAPLLVDLDRRRAGKPATWRQLSVAEDRQLQRADVAVGYRAQLGGRQWLVYRSLAKQAVRTVLGQNLSTEFLFGRFHRSGKVDSLLEIE